MNNIFKFSMFITSFFPLWLSIIVVDIFSIMENAQPLTVECVSIVTIVLLNALCSIQIFYSLKSISKYQYGKFKIISVKPENGITSEYLLSFILPLFVFDFTQWKGVILFLIFFSTLCFLCLRNNNVYANLLFELKKYRFYRCVVVDSAYADNSSFNMEKLVISKQRLVGYTGSTVKLASLNYPVAIMEDESTLFGGNIFDRNRKI